MDRIEEIYRAIDQMASAHGTKRPERHGGGIWNFDEEIEIWKKQILGNESNPLSALQWSTIDSYIEVKRQELNNPTKCWLCVGVITEKPTMIEVKCETPGGKPCESKQVPVHFGCYMDMES